MRAILQLVGDACVLALMALGCAALLGLATGCMSTTVKFDPVSGKVTEIQHANLFRVGTAIVNAPAEGGADVATTAQGMSEELRSVMTAGIEKAP